MDPQQNQNPIIPPSVPMSAQPASPAPQAPLASEPPVVPPTQPIVTPQPMTQPVQTTTAPPYVASESSKKGLVIGAIVLVVLLIAGGGAYALLGKKSTSTASSGGASSSTSHASGSSSSNTSSTTPAAVATTTKNACDLYTLADAKVIMGAGTISGSAVPAVLKNNVSTTVCIYSSDIDSLMVAVSSAANSGGDSEITSQWSKIVATGLTSVSGVGDKAYYNAKAGSGQAIAVLQGYTLIAITENKGNQSQLSQIAKTVISNF